ncbi:tail tube [Vibrio phage EniLVp02]
MESKNLNQLHKNSFVLEIPDNRETEKFQWNIQSVVLPSVSVTQAPVVKSPKIGGTVIPGSALEYEQLQIQFMVDEGLLSYMELYRWLLTINNPMGATSESPYNTPRTVLIHVRDNTQDKIVATFRFREMYLKMIGEMELNFMEGADIEPVTVMATFDYIDFEVLDADGKVVQPRPFQ